MELIGRGEAKVKEILHELMPNAEITTQVPLYNLLLPDQRIGLSERQQKETIDIVVNRKFKKTLCVRIQDVHHFSKRFGQIDGVQRAFLEKSYNEVCDIYEHECPQLFLRDKTAINKDDRDEVMFYLKPYL